MTQVSFFFATDHTVVWLDTVSHCYTNSLAIEYTFFEELFAAIILIFMKCRFYTIYAHKNISFSIYCFKSKIKPGEGGQNQF